MTWKGWISALALLVFAAGWLGCMTGDAPKPYVCAADDIRIGDTLIISLLDMPEPILDKEFVIRTDGTINMPYLGSVKATDKTFGQFERELQNAYIEKKIFRQITVAVKPGFRFYSVGGEVKAPDRKTYSGSITVLRAIVSCGDFNEFAKRRKVELIRANGDREVVDCIKARQDPRFDRLVCPGDAIFVPRSL
jgi:protein involved in polysaccharide export with SLBB domain